MRTRNAETTYTENIYKFYFISPVISRFLVTFVKILCLQLYLHSYHQHHQLHTLARAPPSPQLSVHQIIILQISLLMLLAWTRSIATIRLTRMVPSNLIVHIFQTIVTSRNSSHLTLKRE